MDKEQCGQLIKFTAISGTNDEILAQLSAIDINSEVYREGVNDLHNLVQSLRSLGMPEYRFQLDLRIARGLDYYTGTVYETILKDHPEIGSVCSGGRFDDLASHYTTTKLPGVGISIGLTRLFYKLREIGVIQPGPKSQATTVILPLSAEQYSFAIEVSSELRKLGVPNILYTEQDDLRKKMKYANAMGFRHAVIIGSDEVAQRHVSIRTMANRQDRTIRVGQLASFDW